MVTGYRQRSLADELQGARDVLDAAGIAFESTATAPSHRRRSTACSPGRFAKASPTCCATAARITARSRSRSSNGGFTVAIVDDGVGGVASAGGSGLHGLRERVGAAGGRVEAGPGERGGFRLQAYVPRAAT